MSQSKSGSESLYEEENDEGEDNVPSSTPRTALSMRAMQRAGFLIQDTPMLSEGDNGDGAITKIKNKNRKFYDPDEEEDEFSRDYYLGEEGPTFDTGSNPNPNPTLP